MKEFLATLAIIAIIAGVGFYAAGWLTVQQADNETTIEVKTGDIQQAADEAAEAVVDSTREIVGKVKEEVREEVREHTVETPASDVELAPSQDAGLSDEQQKHAPLSST